MSAATVEADVIDLPTKHSPAVVDDRFDTRREWAGRIAGALGKSVEGIIEAGALLTEAKADLAHGEFLYMVKADLRLTPRTAQRLMAIAANPVLSNGTKSSYLPTSWTTLYELSRWEPRVLEAAVRKHGRIKSDTRRADLEPIRKNVRQSLGLMPGRSKSISKAKPVEFFTGMRRQFDADQIAALNSLNKTTIDALQDEVAKIIVDAIEDAKGASR